MQIDVGNERLFTSMDCIQGALVVAHLAAKQANAMVLATT